MNGPTHAALQETRPGENEFLALLKRSTQYHHQALEATDISRLLMSPSLNVEAYTRILYAFYGAFAPFEAMLLEALKNNRINFSIDFRASLAVEDIRDLTGTFDPSILLCPPPRQQQPSTAKALGTLYVLEGSKLGGKVISRQISKTIGVTPLRGGRFFAGTGGSGTEGWKEFRSQCESHVKLFPLSAEEIIESANDTFCSIQDYFDRFYSATS
ncbi:biliverdin-producing heme oxygenase [Salmonirosea aquatica]|uniref:Heme oxygenase n=1 Tax=Salmonirosea aquatica TaxID=2654236 RepID=A0A7C9BFB5_9BACT|nr:hypothetical protein [Cytophagaceae bacterium SJW1-29]